MFNEPQIHKLIIPRQLQNSKLTKNLDAGLSALGNQTKSLAAVSAGGTTGSKFLKFAKKLMRKAFLNSVMGMFDFLKLIVYSPLMMINFPSNSMMLFDNLI